MTSFINSPLRVIILPKKLKLVTRVLRHHAKWGHLIMPSLFEEGAKKVIEKKRGSEKKSERLGRVRQKRMPSIYLTF